jgi:DNA-binding transcriptional ArsR family regulator
MSEAELERVHLERVARLFAALAEPTRLAILQKLKTEPMAVKDLVEALEAKQANVSKQLGVLYDAGLVERRREGGLVVYSIKELMIFDLCHLVCDKLRRDAEQQIASLNRLTGT